MEALKLAWRGEERLWKVFWIYGVAGNFAVSLLAHEVDMHLWAFLGKLFHIIGCLYFIFSAILQWRCAFNAERRIWGLLVRLLVIVNIVAQAFFLDYVLFIKAPQKSVVKTHHVEVLDSPTEADSPPPLASGIPAVSAEDKYRTACEQNMADYARKNGVDPKTYIAQNQAYIERCVQYYMSKDKSAR